MYKGININFKVDRPILSSHVFSLINKQRGHVYNSYKCMSNIEIGNKNWIKKKIVLDIKF